jgi:hypothetical protein
MADNEDNQRHANDDELLADAIPIPLDELEGAAPVEEEDLEPIDLEEADTTQTKQEIRTFGGNVRHEDAWTRTPNITKQGAIHVKTFVAKLRLDAIDNLDQQVNEWLDAHPEYEVKQVSTSVGTLIGKVNEDAIFMNVWV